MSDIHHIGVYPVKMKNTPNRRMESRTEVVQGSAAMALHIKDVRESRGLGLEELTRLLNERFKTNYKWQTVQKWEQGNRRLRTEIAAMLAEVLGCGVSELDDALAETRETVPVVGYVGAGAEVVNFDDAGEIDRADAYGLPGTVALIVRGDSMWPAYYEGDLLYYHPRKLIPPEELIGRDAVVQLKDGRTFVKRIERGTKRGKYRLDSHNAPSIHDVEILWTSKIQNVHKA
jgi:phage repressor protein C with HTH and peptisase S24 domain